MDTENRIQTKGKVMVANTFNFDTPTLRENTHCEKYDGRLAKFGRADVIPLWVADMDFAAPPCVQQALAERLAHPVFGYSFAPDSLYESIYGWFERRHEWKINPAQLLLTPGVVPSLFACIQALTKKGDGVIVPTPVYPPFFSAVTKSERQLLVCPLKETNSGYSFDFDLLEQQAQQAKMLLLCSPHNPVGRVWREDELKQLVELALRHDLIIVSDDIHCDLILRPAPSAQPSAPARHIPLATLAPKELRLVTCISPSKTFNIPGLNLSALTTSHSADKKAIKQVFGKLHINPFNPINMTAFEAAYAGGDAWLDALLVYLTSNQNFVLDNLKSTPIQCQPSEATALMWLDCRALNLSNQQLTEFFVQQAGLGLNDGFSFGATGNGFMRLNIGTQKAVLEQALAQLTQALV